VLTALLYRQSVRPRRLCLPGPDEAALQHIVAAGLRGIDHGGLRPWRLVLITDRQRLAQCFEEAERTLRPNADADRMTRAREKAFTGPVALAIIARPNADHTEVPVYEQWIAIGAALQQMLLAAQALGFAGSVLSGRKTTTPPLREAFDLADEEHLIGFLTLGTAQPSPDRATQRPIDTRAFWTLWPS
jgi:nitroreductase